MTPRAFCQPGFGEPLKLCWHAALGALAIGAFAYNATAFLLRRQPHLLRNALVYGALTALEATQMKRHWH